MVSNLDLEGHDARFTLWDMEGAQPASLPGAPLVLGAGVRPHIAQEGKVLITADARSAAQPPRSRRAEHVILWDTHHGGGNISTRQPYGYRARRLLR